MFILSAGNSLETHLPSSNICQKASGDVASSGNWNEKPTTARGGRVLLLESAILEYRQLDWDRVKKGRELGMTFG